MYTAMYETVGESGCCCYCCFDSRGGSRLVGLMRQIEFIGSTLDQEGLRFGIKKGAERFGIA